jgi:hypothetical protein
VRGNIDSTILSGTAAATTTLATYPAGTLWKDFAPCVSSATSSCGATVDGGLATVKIPNTNSGTQSVELHSFNFAAGIPAEAAAGTGTVTITATSSQQVQGSGRMEVVFVPGDGSATTAVTSKTCTQALKCTEAAISASTAPAFTVPYAALSGAKVRYSVTNTEQAPIEVWLDGLSLSVAFDAPLRTTVNPGTYVAGQFERRPEGERCLVGTQLAIRGTVYAPWAWSTSR